MTQLLTQTFSTKANALRGAKRAGVDLETLNLVPEEGRWMFRVVEPVAVEPVAAEPAPVVEVEPAPVVALETAKPLRYKEFASKDRSTLAKPFEVVRAFLKANPTMKRKDAVLALVKMGVNYSTARTQYQRWLDANR